MSDFNLPASLRRALQRIAARRQAAADDPLAGYVDLPRWMLHIPSADKLPVPFTRQVESDIRVRRDSERTK